MPACRITSLKACSWYSEWATPSSGETTCSILNFGRITPKRKSNSVTEFLKRGVGGYEAKWGRQGGFPWHLYLKSPEESLNSGMARYGVSKNVARIFLSPCFGSIHALLEVVFILRLWPPHPVPTAVVDTGSSRDTTSVEESFPFSKQKIWCLLD